VRKRVREPARREEVGEEDQQGRGRKRRVGGRERRRGANWRGQETEESRRGRETPAADKSSVQGLENGTPTDKDAKAEGPEEGRGREEGGKEEGGEEKGVGEKGEGEKGEGVQRAKEGRGKNRRGKPKDKRRRRKWAPVHGTPTGAGAGPCFDGVPGCGTIQDPECWSSEAEVVGKDRTFGAEAVGKDKGGSAARGGGSGEGPLGPRERTFEELGRSLGLPELKDFVPGSLEGMASPDRGRGMGQGRKGEEGEERGFGGVRLRGVWKLRWRRSMRRRRKSKRQSTWNPNQNKK